MLEFQDKLINEYFKEAFYFEYKKLTEFAEKIFNFSIEKKT